MTGKRFTRLAPLAGVLALLALAGAALFGHGPASTPVAVGAGAVGLPTGGDTFDPQIGLPVTGLVAFGDSNGEKPGETWAYGVLGPTPTQIEGKSYENQYALVEHSESHSESSSAWQVLALPETTEGKPLTGTGGHEGPGAYGALAGQATNDGGVVLLDGQNIVVRDPTGKPALVPAPQSAPVRPSEGDEHGLAAEESLLPPSASGGGGAVTVPYAAIEEEGDRTGLLIAPYRDGGKLNASTGDPEATPGVLRYNDNSEISDVKAWTREPIEAKNEKLDHFTALAISCAGTQSSPAASSPEDCWLLTGYGVDEVEHLALYRRVRSEETAAGWVWKPQPVSDWLLGNASPPSDVTGLRVAPLKGGAQMLTATAQGVWVDFEARVSGTSAPTDVSELVLPAGESGGEAQVDGTWCYPTGAWCEHSLGASFPSSYRSFAWPGSGSGPGGDPGTRVITGLAGRAMLELSGGAFSYVAGAGGEVGQDPGGAALYRATSGGPVEGWIADGVFKEEEGPDGEGDPQAIALTGRPEGDQLHGESVPFRRPLLAVAQAPGTASGDPDAEALAVGLDGEVGRYVPGAGWRPEGLYNTAGVAQTPTLRGVAWPEPDRAFAVGDNGAMWVWRSETGLWEPDPAKPFNFIGNLTAIAFDPSEPSLGFAVGKQGALLSYGKSWEQISPEESARLEREVGVEEWRLNFTSVAFAGGEALLTYRTVVEEHGAGEIQIGGLLVYGQSSVCLPGTQCWHVDPSAASLLSGLPSRRDTILSKVAGLPDGGAVAAGPNVVIERESPGTGWRLSPTPLPEAQNISALAAYREGGTGPVRAIASIELDRQLNPGWSDGHLQQGSFFGDVPVATGAGQPQPFIPPDPLPDSGYLLQQTANGWTDMEHQTLPTASRQGAGDLPVRPDPVFALLVEPSGAQGLAVGGQTYDTGGGGPEENAETAGVQRFPAASPQSDLSSSPIASSPSQAKFALGGDSVCVELCFDLANEGIGPDVWLTHALQSAQQISGIRAFLYTGGRVPNIAQSTEAFTRELERFQELLGAAGSLPVYVAASRELEPSGIGAGPFEAKLLPGGITRCTTSGSAICPGGAGAYSLTTSGTTGGPVQLIVLDFSRGTLEGPSSSGASPHAQEEWLEQELRAAKARGVPAIVMGADALGFTLPNQVEPVVSQAKDAAVLARILVQGGASAYLFDYPGVNAQTQITYGGASIPAIGSGTLGSEEPTTGKADSLRSSAYLLLSVNTKARDPGTNVAPVSVRAIPNTGELSMNATNGTLLRRSKVALFEGLARRPSAGMAVGGADPATHGVLIDPEAYDPIPTDCLGPNCPYEVPLEYTFTSSNPEVGGFVVHETSTEEAVQVKLNAQDKPIPDEPRNGKGELLPGDQFAENSKGEPVNEKDEVVPASHSALFCPYNEGTTTITITTGGLSYSMPVTVQGGSVTLPCGTVPLKNPPPRIEPGSPFFALPSLAAATPTSPSPTPQVLPTPVPPPPPAAHPAPKLRPRHTPPVYPFLPAAAGLALLRPIIVPPPLSPVEPTPPSGTSSVQVYQNAVAPERERDEEAAMDIVHNMSAHTHDPRPSLVGAHGGGDPTPGVALAAYTHDPGNPLTPYLPAAILLLAVVGAGLYDVRVRHGLRLARSGSRRQS